MSQLVLEESDGALWWIEDPTGAATYESIASTDVLLAASGGDTGGAAIWPWVLGGLAVAGGIAVAASSGGGGVATMMMTIRTPARRAILPIRIPHRQMRLPTFNSPQMVKLSQVLLNPAVRLR